MSRYVLSSTARADLEQIWAHTYERWDGNQAQAYVRETQHSIERIVDNPMIGRACDTVCPGYRKHSVGSHTLYYRIVGSDTIDVVRVLHQRMDVDRHLD